jgi:valyl-tRNA synthetase
MPFITEEIWQRLPGAQGSIMKADFPEPSDFPADNQPVQDMELIMGVITGIRNVRGEMNIHPSKRVDIQIEMPETKDIDILRENIVHIRNLAKVNSVEIDTELPKPEASATAVFGDNQVHILLKGLIDFEEERKRIKKEIIKVQKEIAVTGRKLSNKGFLQKAPEDVVDKVREKQELIRVKLDKLEKNLNFFETIND